MDDEATQLRPAKGEEQRNLLHLPLAGRGVPPSVPDVAPRARAARPGLCWRTARSHGAAKALGGFQVLGWRCPEQGTAEPTESFLHYFDGPFLRWVEQVFHRIRICFLGGVLDFRLVQSYERGD